VFAAVPESNNEVGHVVVHLAIVQVRNCEPEAFVLDERLNIRMRIDEVPLKLSKLTPSAYSLPTTVS